MGKSVCFAFILVSLSFSTVLAIQPGQAQTPDSWTKMGPLPENFYDVSGATVLNGKIYVVTLSESANVTVWEYSPSADTWKAKSLMPNPVARTAVVAYKNKIYMIGGFAEDGSRHGTNQVYDPTTDTWETKAPMATGRTGLQANLVNGKIYLIGGQLPSSTVSPSSENDVYDPDTDSWSEMAPLPNPVISVASAVLDNKIYLIGGSNGPLPQNKGVKLVQIFDPATNNWTMGTPIPIGVSAAKACATTGLMAPKRIYVIGGANYNEYVQLSVVNLNQVYDPKTDN